MKTRFLLLAVLPVIFSRADVTPIQTTTYAGGEIDEFDDLIDGLGSIFFFEEEVLTGLEKFDPALGELQEVRNSLTGDAVIDFFLFSDSLIDESAPFTAIFEPDFENSASFVGIGLVYIPGEENTVLGVGLDFFEVPVIGFEDEDPEFWTIDDFYFEDFLTENFFLYDGVEEPPFDVVIRMDDPDVDPDDFIGQGEVTALTFEVYGDLNTTESRVDNLEQASLAVSLDYSEGEVFVEYVYRPFGPEILAYAIEGGIHRLTFSGDPGIEGWQVFGGDDLLTFENNHTGQTVISETSSGVYQADISLPGVTGPRYFLRVASASAP